jgi:hypothetical protein
VYQSEPTYFPRAFLTIRVQYGWSEATYPKVMKLIVDSGALSKSKHHETLRSHLAKSVQNGIVLTDFALGEVCNGANIGGLKWSFKVLAEFPAQVEVLKPTPLICRLQPGRETLHERFTDDLESNKFRAFLHNLFTNAEGIEGTIAKKAEQAHQQFSLLADAGEGIRNDIQGQLAELPKEGLKKLRGENRVTAEMANALVRSVVYNTKNLMREYSGFSEEINPRDAVYSFPLRFVLANYVLGLHWGIKGGVGGVAPVKLRNDVTDMTYVAYATLYDGLVTNDGKMAELYQRARSLLPKLFKVEPS